MSPNRRRILVKARDAGGNLLSGTVFVWSEDGQARGRVDPSDGHATFHPVEDDSTIEIVATYEGRQQTRKLAVGQALCEFAFDDVNKPGGSASDAVPAPSASGWKTPAGIAAIVTAIGGIIIGYWQFGSKLGAGDDMVTVVVYVKDGDTKAPLANAQISVESTSLQSPVVSDSEGKAAISSTKGQRMTLVARAGGHTDTTLTISASDQPVQLLMPVAKLSTAAPPPKSGSGASRSAFAPAGTWEVVASGDIALKRIRSGSFDLTPKPDGRFGLAARFDLDGAPAQAAGDVSRQGDRLYVVFEGVRGSDRWKGTGTWSVVDGRLQGFLTDLKGEEVPLSLRKP